MTGHTPLKVPSFFAFELMAFSGSDPDIAAAAPSEV